MSKAMNAKVDLTTVKPRNWRGNQVQDQFINQAAFSGPAECLTEFGVHNSLILNQITKNAVNSTDVAMKFTQTCIQFQMGRDFAQRSGTIG